MIQLGDVSKNSVVAPVVSGLSLYNQGQKRSFNTIVTLSVFLGLMTLLALVLIVGVVVVLRYVRRIIDNLSAAFDPQGIKKYLPFQECSGSLVYGRRENGIVPCRYDLETSKYLSDAMSRYYSYFLEDEDRFVERPDMVLVTEVRTENGSQISCLVLDDPVSKSSAVVFKGTSSNEEWG
jgi:hypothetical protein